MHTHCILGRLQLEVETANAGGNEGNCEMEELKAGQTAEVRGGKLWRDACFSGTPGGTAAPLEGKVNYHSGMRRQGTLGMTGNASRISAGLRSRNIPSPSSSQSLYRIA